MRGPRQRIEGAPWLPSAVAVGLVLVVGAVDVVAMHQSAGHRAIAVAAILVDALAVAIMRRTPYGALGLTFLVIVTLHLGPRAVPDAMFTWVLGIMLTVGYAAYRTTAGLPLLLVVCGLWTAGAALSTSSGEVFEDLLWGILLFTLAPVAVGALLGRHHRLGEALRGRAAELEADRGRRAELATRVERNRVAAELHDVVAHALEAMVAQSLAAEQLVSRDRDGARAAFGQVELAGRDALEEMRRMLGVLRTEDAEIGLLPQPTLARLDELLVRARAAGLDVVAQVDGEPAALPPGVDLTAYRVLQEVLEDARASAGARTARVRVRYEPSRLRLEIADDGAVPAGGRALLGVRERVGVVGGRLTCTAPAGGHLVRSDLPVVAL